jgi:hypothetical protein
MINIRDIGDWFIARKNIRDHLLHRSLPIMNQNHKKTLSKQQTASLKKNKTAE